MRTERDKGLAAEVVFVEERVERHRHIVPPVGESDEDHIVVIEILMCVASFGRALLSISTFAASINALCEPG